MFTKYVALLEYKPLNAEEKIRLIIYYVQNELTTSAEDMAREVRSNYLSYSGYSSWNVLNEILELILLRNKLLTLSPTEIKLDNEPSGKQALLYLKTTVGAYRFVYDSRRSHTPYAVEKETPSGQDFYPFSMLPSAKNPPDGSLEQISQILLERLGELGQDFLSANPHLSGEKTAPAPTVVVAEQPAAEEPPRFIKATDPILAKIFKQTVFFLSFPLRLAVHFFAFSSWSRKHIESLYLFYPIRKNKKQNHV